MKKNEFIQAVSEIFNINEQEAKSMIKDLDLLIEQVFQRMRDEDKTKLGKYIILETVVKQAREGYINPRTGVKSDLPKKKIRKIKQTEKVNEI